MPTKEEQSIAYIGDAVYAKHMGNSIGLRLNCHKCETVVFLETEVLQALVDFARKKGMEIK